ncbi:HprK-related kinase A [Glaciecola sp. 1036]|uniref:HprK-related kinase A n=1 Tax=Alteromonadaceae TaxID=72275 RepID=UPI003D01ECDA
MQEFQLNTSPFVFQISTNVPMVVENAKRIYKSHFLTEKDFRASVDYHLSLTYTGGIRRLTKSQVTFKCDDREPFKPLPANQAFAMLEWGMNWTVALHEFQHVIIHSAVLAKDGKAILFPAPPGSGKSTLTAYLANHGWRLLSDEMALITPYELNVTPFVRAICLKNASINLCKQWFPDLAYSDTAFATHKGDVAHMAPSDNSLACAREQARVVGVVFPNYDKSLFLDIYELDKANAFMQFANNAFNFNLLGTLGFDTATALIENAFLYEIHYNNVEEVERFLSERITNT